MITLFALLLAAPNELPLLANLDRFPSLAACHGQLLYSLINLRAQLKAAPATGP